MGRQYCFESLCHNSAEIKVEQSSVTWSDIKPTRPKRVAFWLNYQYEFYKKAFIVNQLHETQPHLWSRLVSTIAVSYCLWFSKACPLVKNKKQTLNKSSNRNKTGIVPDHAYSSRVSFRPMPPAAGTRLMTLTLRNPVEPQNQQGNMMASTYPRAAACNYGFLNTKINLHPTEIQEV